jgi:hypothetical protein
MSRVKLHVLICISSIEIRKYSRGISIEDIPREDYVT